MVKLISALFAITIAAFVFLHIQWEQETPLVTENTLGAFSDPFLSLQLATTPVNGYCLITDGTNNSWSSTCGSGGGSNWTVISGGLKTSTSTDFAQAAYFVGTSTSIASTFPYASSTGITTTRLFGTNMLMIGSSTIGNGTGAGGLTIDGNATTTGGHYFGSTLTLDAETLDSLTDDATLANNSGDLQVVDVTCTDCLNATEIEDIYLLIAGDTSSGDYTWTGLHSFTYASSTGLTSTRGYFTDATSTTSFFSGLGTFTNSIVNTLLTAAAAVFTGLVDIGAGVLEIPNGTGPTVDSVGELAIDTTSNQLILYGSEKKVIGNGNFYPAFTILATSTAFTGTTTWAIGPSFIAETWNAIQCFTDTGTTTTQIGDGTNFTNNIYASTTVGTVTLSSNNTFVAAEKRYVLIGSPAGSPTKLSCTVSKSITAD